MEMAEAERSFHVTCVPGRPLMWKRVPTKRKFSFSLVKANKSSKSFVKEKSLLSTGNRSTCEKKTNTVENSFKAGKENVIELIKTISSKKTGSLNLTKCSTTDFKRKTSALKDVKNTCERPATATSNACKNFETPVLCLPPTVRRLVNIFMPSNEKTIRSIHSGVWKSSSNETSELSSNEISAVLTNEVSGMVALNQSCPRIIEGKKRVCSENDKEFVPPEADIAVSHMASDSKDLSNEEVKSEDAPDRKRYKHSSATGNENSSKGNTFTHKDTPSNVGVPDWSVISTEQQEIIAPFELRDEKKESVLETAVNKSSVSTSLPLQDAASVYDFTETSDDYNDKGNSNDEPVLLVGQSTDEKIVNTPIYNNLNQLKKKNIALRRSNIQSPYTRRDTTSLVDRSIPHPKILLLSPLHNTSKNSTISNSGNQSYVQKNLNSCDTKDSPEKETQVAQLSEKHPNCNLTKGKDRSARRKINFARKPTGLVIQRTCTISHNTSGGNGPAISSDSRKRYCVSQEVVQCLKKRKMIRNLNPVVLPDDRPDFILAPKSKKKYVRKERQPIKGKFPSKVKVLMCKKAAPKRKVADLMDLEVIFEILNSEYRKEEETFTESDEAERILKSYQKGVIRDVAALIYDSVELQSKANEIKKLYREIERKGKQLGTLIDQQHKIYHGIASGELHFVD